MIRTQIQLTEQQTAALKRLAAKRGVSMAELIRQGVDIVLRAGGGAGPEEQRRRAMSAAGRFRSGRSDLSAKHDEHFAKAQEK